MSFSTMDHINRPDSSSPDGFWIKHNDFNQQGLGDDALVISFKKADQTFVYELPNQQGEPIWAPGEPSLGRT